MFLLFIISKYIFNKDKSYENNTKENLFFSMKKD